MERRLAKKAMVSGSTDFLSAHYCDLEVEFSADPIPFLLVIIPIQRQTRVLVKGIQAISKSKSSLQQVNRPMKEELDS